MSDRAVGPNGPRRRSPAHKRLDRAVPSEQARAAFWRMLKLVYPHRRRMAVGLVLGLGVALTYAASLGGMYPVLKVVIEEGNVRAWLLSRAAGHPDGGTETVPPGSEAPWYGSWLERAANAFPEEDTPAARMRSLVILLAVLVAVNLTGNLCRVFSQYLVLYASHRVVMDLRRQMYRKTLHVPMNAIAGEVSNRVSQFLADVREVLLGISTLFGKFAREPFKAVCVFVVALWIDARLTLVALAIAPIAVATLWYFGRKIRKANTRLLRGYGQLLGGLEETLQGIDVVKGYAREGHERQRMWRLERRILRQQLKMAWIEAFSSPLMEVVGVIAACLAIVWLARQTFAGAMEASHFMTMVILLAAMLDPVRKIANVYNMIQRSGAAATRIFDFLDQPDELAHHNPRTLAGAGPREIRFEHVTFRYTPAQEPPALDDVSLHVRPGECVAIVGPNGSGKSTLVKLLPRLLVPQQGRVTVDGIDVGTLSLRSLRRQIAIVSQRPVIFARSVRDNIAYSDDEATPEEVRAAARKAFADEFIEQWPEKYDTVMGEFGTSVSGGQRQRIAIARAFLKRSSILIFDEATSEIDADSERKIHAALEELRRGKTTFLIAHRHTVMEMADRVVVTDAGQIVDVGTQAELLERCPLYVALYRSPTAG
jgi:ABC-type multidrug transport system fused ATPase/permease subunit